MLPRYCGRLFEKGDCIMKKFLTLLLALAMTFSLAACGGTSDEDAATDDQPTGEEVSGDTAPESDVAYIQDKGTLVVGITYFAPMDYKEEGSDEWIGFDADLAKLFAESLGVSVEFQEITWDYKVQELDSKTIDCVWNGMTINDEVTAAMGVSEPYCTNYQTLVYPADRAADFEGLTSLEGLSIAVESGSAGEDAAEELGATTVPVQAQSNALMEVAAGTSDAAVIDVLMAAEMTGEGTSYGDLVYDLNLNDMRAEASEFYGVGFRKGSDLVDAFNSFWKDAYDAGTVMETAETYGVQESVIEK